MTRDEVILKAIEERFVIVDAEAGAVYYTRGPRGRLLKTHRPMSVVGKGGYIVGTLNSAGERKQVYAHRVVWLAVYGIHQPGYVIDHINNIKSDNRITNLQLLTNRANSWKAFDDGLYKPDSSDHTKVPSSMREEVVRDYYVHNMTYSRLSSKYGVNKSRVGQILREQSHLVTETSDYHDLADYLGSITDREWSPHEAKQLLGDSCRLCELPPYVIALLVRWLGSWFAKSRSCEEAE